MHVPGAPNQTRRTQTIHRRAPKAASKTPRHSSLLLHENEHSPAPTLRRRAKPYFALRPPARRNLFQTPPVSRAALPTFSPPAAPNTSDRVHLSAAQGGTQAPTAHLFPLPASTSAESREFACRP